MDNVELFLPEARLVFGVGAKAILNINFILKFKIRGAEAPTVYHRPFPADGFTGCATFPSG